MRQWVPLVRLLEHVKLRVRSTLGLLARLLLTGKTTNELLVLLKRVILSGCSDLANPLDFNLFLTSIVVHHLLL